MALRAQVRIPPDHGKDPIATAMRFELRADGTFIGTGYFGHLDGTEGVGSWTEENGIIVIRESVFKRFEAKLQNGALIASMGGSLGEMLFRRD